MSLAVTSGLSFAYGGAPRCALRDVNLEVREGDFVLVTGASGGGKSTLLRCFNGLVPHFHGGSFRGQVTVGGLDTRHHQPREFASVAGFVFQEPEAQRVARTVQEEIVFGMENRGMPALVIRKRLEEALDALGLAALRTRDMQTLSGGELQRVAIASVFSMQPRLMLLDEPTSQLDPQAADDVLRLARDLRDDYGLAIIIAEHRLERALAASDRVWQLPGDGTVEELAPRQAARELAGAPPVSRIGHELGWSPIPLSITEARRHASATQRTVAPAPIADHRPGDPLASMSGVEVQLGGRTVLKVDRLVLHEGEAIGLMGRNGAGKSTLLRALAGLVPLTRGTVDGVAGRGRDDRFKDLAFVPQDPGASLYKERLDAELKDVLQGTGRTADLGDALANWHLEPFAERDARDLSVGERQRAALCALTIGDPRLVLLDEPTRGMDAAARELLIRNVRRMTARGACVLVASHDVELIASLAHRVVLLAEGEVIADGTARSVLTGSIAFSTQANKLCGGEVLTVEEAVTMLRGAG